MLKKPRICGVGMFNPVFNIQLHTLLETFKDYGIQTIRTTHYQGKLMKFIDIIFFLIRKRKNYDVIHVQAHTNFNFISLLISLFFAKLLRKKIVIMFYGGAAKEFFNKAPSFFKSIFKHIDKIVVAGNYVKSAFDKLNIETSIIPHILDIKSWPFKQRKETGNKLLWVRHLRKEYNPLMLLKVFKKLKSNYPDLKLQIVGTGDMQESMTNFINKNQLSDIIFHGRVSDEKLRSLFIESDIFINTTNVDNQPVSVLESMICGCPVVSTNPGGVPDIVEHGKNGLLCNPNDVETMTLHISTLLNDASIAENFSRNGHNFILNTFSPEVIIKQWDEVYQKISYRLV